MNQNTQTTETIDVNRASVPELVGEAPPAHAAPGARPEVAQADPVPSKKARRRGALRRWRARFIVLLMLAAAFFGGQRLVDARTSANAQGDIGTVTLTADPVPVQAARLGVVKSVRVAAHQRVAAGQLLGTMTTLTTTGSGVTLQSLVPLTAPIAGTVSDDPVPLGSALQPGDTFVTLYDPGKLKLIGNVSLAQLPKLAPGMAATLRADGLPAPINATLGQVLPRVGNEQSSVKADHIEVELTSIDPARLAQLVPGLRFDAKVDTQTGAGAGHSSVYVPK